MIFILRSRNALSSGKKHVAIKVVASPTEHEIVTTSPAELMRKKSVGKEKEQDEQIKEVTNG